MTDAYFVDPVLFTFTNPVTNTVKSLHVHVDHKLPFYDKIGSVTALCLNKLGGDINEAHNQLLVQYVATRGFSNETSRLVVRPEWVEPHLCKNLPFRQGNGVVWQAPIPRTE